MRGVRRAIADGADGIVLYAIDCAAIQAGLEQAAKAKIKVVGVESADCNQTSADGRQLFDGSLEYTQGDIVGWERGLGEAQAAWIATQTGGKRAEVIELYETDLYLTRLVHQGFVAGLKRYCPSCEIVDTVEFGGVDFGPKLQEKTTQALLQHPEATALAAPYDGVFQGGVAAAVRGSGRKDTISSIGGVGESAALDLIRKDAGWTRAMAYRSLGKRTERWTF